MKLHQPVVVLIAVVLIVVVHIVVVLIVVVYKLGVQCDEMYFEDYYLNVKN